MAWCCREDKAGCGIHEALLAKIYLGTPGVPFITRLLWSSGVSVLSCQPPAARHGQSLKCDLQPPPAAFPSWWQLLHKVPTVHNTARTAPSVVPKEGLMLKMHRARSARSRQGLRMPKHYCCPCAHPPLHHIYHPCHGVQPQGRGASGWLRSSWWCFHHSWLSREEMPRPIQMQRRRWRLQLSPTLGRRVALARSMPGISTDFTLKSPLCFPGETTYLGYQRLAPADTLSLCTGVAWCSTAWHPEGLVPITQSKQHCRAHGKLHRSSEISTWLAAFGVPHPHHPWGNLQWAKVPREEGKRWRAAWLLWFITIFISCNKCQVTACSCQSCKIVCFLTPCNYSC